MSRLENESLGAVELAGAMIAMGLRRKKAVHFSVPTHLVGMPHNGVWSVCLCGSIESMNTNDKDIVDCQDCLKILEKRK